MGSIQILRDFPSPPEQLQRTIRIFTPDAYDQQPDQRTERRIAPQQGRAGEESQQFAVPAFHRAADTEGMRSLRHTQLVLRSRPPRRSAPDVRPDRAG